MSPDGYCFFTANAETWCIAARQTDHDMTHALPAAVPASFRQLPHPTTEATRMPQAAGPQSQSALREAAQALEAGFLAEMLKAAGLHDSGTSFSGGAGEEQFASFLIEAQAETIVAAGGIGLAEAIFDSLKERSHGR